MDGCVQPEDKRETDDMHRVCVSVSRPLPIVTHPLLYFRFTSVRLTYGEIRLSVPGVRVCVALGGSHWSLVGRGWKRFASRSRDVCWERTVSASKVCVRARIERYEGACRVRALSSELWLKLMRHAER